MKKFICRRCGNCCRWEGIVHYIPEEGARIADFLGITEDELIQNYTRLSADRSELVFTDKEDGSCIFLTDDNLCLINPVKPHQCSSFPYEWGVPDSHMKLCKGYWTEDGDTE